MEPAAQSAPVAAQRIDEKASLSVAAREATWRRRNMDRFAAMRNQSWMAVEAEAARRAQTAVITAIGQAASVSRIRMGTSTARITASTASILARRMVP
ncbi:hypothetical protein D3C87_1853210 [compost metagenome]